VIDIAERPEVYCRCGQAGRFIGRSGNSPGRRKSKFLSFLAESKFAAIEGFARKKKGRISLQDHNGAYRYRNLKIREIPQNRKEDR